MSDFVFNRAKGRIVQFVEEVRASSAYASSGLSISLWRRGSATDDALMDHDTVAAIEADAQAAELVSGTNANYARKTLIDTTPTITYDDTNNRVDVDIPDQTWVALGAGGTAITDLLISWVPIVGTSTDSDMIPLTFHAFSITPDGSDVIAQINSAGFFRAQ